MTSTTTPTVTAGSIILSQNSYGKSEVRVVKVTRRPDRHDIHDLNVSLALEGNFEEVYVEGDNAGLLATDAMRNTIYALAKANPLESIEEFGLALVDHFLAVSPDVERVRVQIVEFPWERIEVDGRPHEHAFTRGSGERHATLTGDRHGERQVTAGIANLRILKTTNSGFEHFLREQYTTLPDASDRILATDVSASWSYNELGLPFNELWTGVRRRILETFTDHYSPSMQNTLYRMGKAVLEAFPAVEKIHFSFPNKHHLLFDLGRFGMANDNEIFHATDEPYGLIEGTVERSG